MSLLKSYYHIFESVRMEARGPLMLQDHQAVEAAIKRQDELHGLLSRIATMPMVRTYDGDYQCPFRCGFYAMEPGIIKDHAADCPITIARGMEYSGG